MRVSASGRNGTEQEPEAYIVIVGVAHFQATIPLETSSLIIVADNVLERVAAAPLAAVPSNVTLHGV
jgi:hypothetical protein